VWARLLAAAVLVGVEGWGDPRPEWGFAADLVPRLSTTTALSAAALALLIVIGIEQGGAARRLLAALAAAGTVFWVGPDAYARARARWEQGAWRDAQNWVRRNTPRSAVVLTPPSETGFRVFSERTVVGEWKDGTQQYFDDAFVREWGGRMEALGGDQFPQLPDDQLLALARRYGAAYVVLPVKARHPGLADVYKNRGYVVYRAEGR
jgi:hypothetical protein